MHKQNGIIRKKNSKLTDCDNEEYRCAEHHVGRGVDGVREGFAVPVEMLIESPYNRVIQDAEA